MQAKHSTTGMTWRDKCAPIIAKVLQEHIFCDEKMINKALHDAYPFRERAMHPYKIWLDEIKRQRKNKPVSNADIQYSLF